MVTNSGFNYKEAIIEMISKMKNPLFFKKIYSFIIVFYRKEMGAK